MSGLLSSCAAPPSAGVTIERHAITLNLLVDGSVEIREVLTVRFAGTAVSAFDRHVARERADAFFDVHVAFDGRPVDATTEPGRADADATDALTVHWEFPPTSDGTHEFVVEYRASNVVSVHGANGLLYWPLMPLQPEYRVEASELTMTVPRGTVFMEPPTIDAPVPWSVELAAAELSATRTGIGPGETATLRVRLAIDSFSLAEPEWQYEAARAAQLVPAWASGGLFMIIIGFGAIWMLRLQYPDHRRGLQAGEPVAGSEPPPPAVVQALLRRRRGRAGREIPAALQGLLDRGVITVTRGEGRGSDLRPTDTIVLADVPDDLLEHERALVDELWLGKGVEGTRIGDLQASRRVRRTFSAALVRDLTNAGYATAERIVAADGLRVAAAVIIALALLCAAAIPVVLGRYGVWPYAVPAGIFLMGLMLLPFSATFSILTEAGERTAMVLRRRR